VNPDQQLRESRRAPSGADANPLFYPLDQILTMYVLARCRGVLIHAAGWQMGERGYLFPGRSGRGKSTISRLLIEAGLGQVIGDDRIVARERSGVFRIFGTPWPGELGIVRNTSVPLCGMFFLTHAEENRIVPLSATAAVERLFPVASIPWYETDVLSEVLATCEELVTGIPAYEFRFTPDARAPALLAEFTACHQPLSA
jgi:hypothetical protein